jgi:steroid delta-isomerase-like uncharacterized protein
MRVSAVEIAERYFAAWNRRDPEGIVATFAEGGVYRDPSVPDGLRGAAIGAYARGLFEAFPDLSFDLFGVAPTGERGVVAQWVMRGTNTGPMQGLPPTGKSVAVPGADFLTVGDGGVESVQGYFDTRTLPEQLGLQVLVQPRALGPVRFGNSVRMTTGKKSKPGAFSMTWLETPDTATQEEVRARTRAMFPELAQMPGFIGVMTATVGERMVTLSAWEDAEGPRRLMREGKHKDAMDWFFGQNGCTAAITTVWVPEHFNPMRVRCAACGVMANYDRDEGVCRCGQKLPDPPPYW